MAEFGADISVFRRVDFLHYGLFFFLILRFRALRVKDFVYFDFRALVLAAFTIFLPGCYRFWDIDKFMGRIFPRWGPIISRHFDHADSAFFFFVFN